MAANSELLTISEASALLRLKSSTLRAWILKRKLSYCKLGSRVLIRRATLMHWFRRAWCLPPQH